MKNYEHRVVAEAALGRPLSSDEVVHHVNLDKGDNRVENLHVCSKSEHQIIHRNLERLAARLVEAGYLSFVPELGDYIFVGPKPKLEQRWESGGFIVVKDVMGSDATVVNAARVSFGKSISEIREQDKKLLSYLAKNGHTSPFRHVTVQFHIKAPEFVARQWYKHIIGSDYTFKDTAWNEVSGRYVELTDEFYIPTTMRAQSKDNKQASQGVVDDQEEALRLFTESVQSQYDTYKKLIEMGVAKEQAREILPLNFYTEWYWTASLQAIANFVQLRDHGHAQIEIRDYAIAINDFMQTLFPHSWKELVKRAE